MRLWIRSKPRGSFRELEYVIPQSNFTEGIYIDYKALKIQRIARRYKFGYRLTYTAFSYSHLTIQRDHRVDVGFLPGESDQGRWLTYIVEYSRPSRL
jgi:hypothetical protein